MDTMNPYSHLETPTLSINHCSDASCSHPSCWASRKLYRRNAYLLMLKGEPTSEVHHKERLPERTIATHREIPTQKVHNIVDELFRSTSDTDDWHSVARGISAGQLSIKHMPTPMSSLSRNASKLHQPEEFGADTDEEADDAAEKARKPALGQVFMQDMFQPSGPHSVYHSREYVWVPNPNRQPRPTQRRSEQDAVGRVNINEELGQYLHEDTYNQRQAALQERAVERSHLSTARVQRFFKTCAPASSTKHIDLFKLPSDLLSEVLRNVDEGEPMTNESLAKMVEQAETPTGGAGVGGGNTGGRDFQQHVLHQRRAQLHNSHSGRNLREPQKHATSSTAARPPPVFLVDAGAASKKRQTPPPPPPPPAGRQLQQQQRLPPIGRAATVTGQFKRSIASHCQLMLGPVGGSADGDSAEPTGGRRPASEAAAAADAAADDAASMAVECRSDRSTLLDEVLPSRQPGTQDSAGFAALLALNRPSYDLDDPWADAAEGPHPTTRNQSVLLTVSSSLSEPQQPPQPAPLSADVVTDVGAGGASLSLTTPAPDAAEAGDDDDDAGGDAAEDVDDDVGQGSLGAELTTGRVSPGPPPPSPDVDSAAPVVATGRVSSPPPAGRSGAALMSSKAKSAASSGQMPTLNEDEEAN